MRSIGAVFATLLIASNAYAATWSTAGGCDIDHNIGRDDVVHLHSNSEHVDQWYNSEIVGHEWGCSLFVTGQINNGHRAIGFCQVEGFKEIVQLDIKQENNTIRLFGQTFDGSFEIDLVNRCY